MPRISITVPHELGQAEASSRLQGFTNKIKEKYADQIKDLEEEIGENSGRFSFKTMGAKISGDIAISDSEVNLNCDMPFVLAMFKGRIESEMRTQLERVLKA